MDLTIIQSLILGIIQGITEWLPISSSAMTTLVMTNLYEITDLNFLIHQALLLHLGTFLAALIYFWKDVKRLLFVPIKSKPSTIQERKIFKFILIATIISGIIGFIVLKSLTSFEDSLIITGKTITFFIGFLLLLTAVIQIKIKHRGLRKEEDLKTNDGVVLGVAQGLATLPGLSRSGITVSSLLLKKFDDTTALKLSFLMSLPIVLIGNIVLNFSDFSFSGTAIYGLLASFVLGLLTIHGLMKLSKKINFGWFVLIFSVLMMVSVLF